MKHVLKDIVVPVRSFIFAIYYGYEDVRRKSKSKRTNTKNAKLPFSKAIIFTIGRYIVLSYVYFPRHTLIRKKLNSFFFFYFTANKSQRA